MRRNHTAVMGIVTTDTTAATENLYPPLDIEVAAVSAIATVCPAGHSSRVRTPHRAP